MGNIYTWDTTCVIILRTMLGDIVEPFTYSDQRLLQLLLVGARFVVTEVSTNNTYQVDLNAMKITPDPEQAGDNSMIILSTLRAACFLDQSEMRSKASSALKISDVRSSIDTTPLVLGFKLLMDKGYCHAYDEAKFAFLSGGLQGNPVGQAILGPFAIISTFGAPGYMYSPNSPIGRETFT